MFEYGGTSRRKAIACAKTLSQAKILQLPDVALEVLFLLISSPTQVAGANTRMSLDQFKGAQRPWRSVGARIQPSEPPHDVVDLRTIGHRLTQSNSRIGFQTTKLDAVELTLDGTTELRQQRFERWVPSKSGVGGRDLCFGHRDHRLDL